MFPSLPSDNFYKFLLIGGIFLLITAGLVSWYEGQALMDKEAAVRSLIVAHFGPNPEEQKKLGETFDELFTTKQQATYRQKWAELDKSYSESEQAKFRELCGAIENLWKFEEMDDSLMTIPYILMAMALVPVIWGLIGWQKHQLSEDTKTYYEAANLKKDLEGAMPPTTKIEPIVEQRVKPQAKKRNGK